MEQKPQLVVYSITGYFSKVEVLILQGQGPFNVDWTRKDGRPLPSRAEILENYDLIIRNAQPSDSGIYVITVISSFGTSTDEVEVEVLGKGLCLRAM